MAFNQAYQAIIGEIGHLALGACGITIGSTAMGHFNDAGFSIDSTNKIVKSGYPQRPICSMVESITARAYVSLDELGSPAVKGLLTDIINSLSANSAPPTRDVSMEVFRPVGSNVIVNFNDAALLQQFELSL